MAVYCVRHKLLFLKEMSESLEFFKESPIYSVRHKWRPYTILTEKHYGSDWY